MDFILLNFGEEAFNNISDDGGLVKKFHPTIFDAISIATTDFLKKKSEQPKNLKGKRLQLLANEDFKRYISIRTTNLESIKGRISKARKILYG
jgi:hypothetical protein